MNEDTALMRQRWISEAEIILGAGKGHLGVINYLRSQGMNGDDAKKASYDIFDQAKSRLMRSQLPQTILGWILIAIGVVTPIALFVLQARVVIFSLAPILGGIFVLFKVVKPSRLPEEWS